MYLKPILTEKSLNEAKKGNYTFIVDPGMNKFQIRRLINETFDVNVMSVKTILSKKELKRIYSGKRRIIQPKKKAIVTLKAKEKISLFEAKK